MSNNNGRKALEHAQAQRGSTAALARLSGGARNNGKNGRAPAHDAKERAHASQAASQAPEEGKTPAADKTGAILEERARALAKVTTAESSETMQLVVFTLAHESYGIATDYVREVQPLRDVSPVPCAPPFVVGIINIRGAIYSVIDIREFFGVPKQEITDLTKVILVNVAGLAVGILADDVPGARSVALAEIKPPLSSRATAKEEYVQGVTQDMLIILNLEALLLNDRIVVHEEIA